MGMPQKTQPELVSLGHPIAYVTDVLQTLEVLTALGYGGDALAAPGAGTPAEQARQAGTLAHGVHPTTADVGWMSSTEGN